MFPGDQFQLADAELKKNLKLVLNEAFPGPPTDGYSNILYFYNSYYLSVQKQVFQSCGIETAEE